MVSVIVPTYNSQKHIYNNLTNLVENIPDVVEIIVVDDGSTDNTAEEVRDFINSEEKRGQIFLIERDHKNPASVRNAGWKSAKSDIVIFLDSDCSVTEEWYEEMLKPFKEKDVVAVSGVYLSKQKNFIARYIQDQTTYRQGKVKRYTDNLATYSLAVKKKFLKKIGGFPENYPHASCEDTEFSYKLRKYGKFVLNKKAKVFHKHEESIMKYLKKQFIHAKYRILMFKRGNPVGDKYAGLDLIVQPFFASLSLLFLLNPMFLFFFGALIYLQMREIEKMMDEFSFILFSTIIGTVRAYVWLFGMVFGVLEFYL